MNLRPFFTTLLLVFFGYFLFEFFSQAGRFGSADREWVIHWHHEEGVVFASNNKIMLLRPEAETRIETLFEFPSDLTFDDETAEGGCFASRSWHFSLENNANVEAPSNSRMWELAWDGLVPSAIVSSAGYKHGHTFNRIDCEFVESGIGVTPFSVPIGDNEFKDLTPRPDLFSRSHLENVYLAELDGKSVLGGFSNGSAQSVSWSVDIERVDKQIRQDRSTSTYFVFPRIKDAGEFSQKSIPVLKFDGELFKTEAVTLPNGPWAGEYKERFRCFSCGCGCYRDINFFPAGDKVLAHIFGIGFPKDMEGLYSMSLAGGQDEWIKVVDGPINRGIAVSPSGCRVAYSQENLQVLDICE